MRVNRRAVLGLGTLATAGTVLSTTAPALAATEATAPAQAAAEGGNLSTATRSATDRVADSYRRNTGKAGGTWRSYVSLVDASGQSAVPVDERATDVVEAYSVNKIAVATAVLDKVDRGLLSLNQRIDVDAAIVVQGGDGIFSLDGAYPSSVTLGHVLAALLTVSDDTAVRLCGLVCPAAELNEILVAKGFPNTQVQPVANPNRFYLGRSTAKEMHDLLQALVAGRLLSAGSTSFLLNLLRSPIAFTDGIRRTMSSDERARIATKAGWYGDARHEAGIIFDADGRPVLTYVLFSFGAPDPDNFGATHPAVQARAVMGRDFLDAVGSLAGTGATALRKQTYRPSNGG